MSVTITSHILDLGSGKPAVNVEATLYKKDTSTNEWLLVGKDVTNQDGRMSKLLNDAQLEIATYKVIFESGKYYLTQNLRTFYPQITIEFEIFDNMQKYHVPLLLNQYGYSTYRGS